MTTTKHTIARISRDGTVRYLKGYGFEAGQEIPEWTEDPFKALRVEDSLRQVTLSRFGDLYGLDRFRASKINKRKPYRYEVVELEVSAELVLGHKDIFGYLPL